MLARLLPSRNRAGFLPALVPMPRSRGFAPRWPAAGRSLRAGPLRRPRAFLAAKPKRCAAPRAGPEISIFTFFRFPGLRAFARRPRASGRAANATGALISASSCMDCGPSMSMAIHRTAVPRPGSRHAWRSTARKDFIPMKDLPGTNGRNTAPAPGKVPPTISPRCGARAIQSSFPRRLSPPRSNRRGRRSI